MCVFGRFFLFYACAKWIWFPGVVCKVRDTKSVNNTKLMKKTSETLCRPDILDYLHDEGPLMNLARWSGRSVHRKWWWFPHFGRDINTVSSCLSWEMMVSFSQSGQKRRRVVKPVVFLIWQRRIHHCCSPEIRGKLDKLETQFELADILRV